MDVGVCKGVEILRLATAYRCYWLICGLALGLIAFFKNRTGEVCRELAG